MAVTLDINGIYYYYPEVGDLNWGSDATDWATAVTSGMLQKAGGTFTLTAEVDFGTGFGLKSLYYKTRTTSPATAGQFRLARADVISWRNQANSANLDLSVDATNTLLFNGSSIGGGGTWGSITGTLSAQTDLQTALNLKANLISPVFTTPNIGSATGSISGNAATVTTNANLTGDVTSVGNATTLTNAPVIAKVLTGYVSGSGTVAAADSILQAIQKLNGNAGLVSVPNAVAHSTGIITGGLLSIGSPTTTFSISNGTGMVVDNTVTPATVTQVSWTGKTNITGTYIASGLVSYIAIDSTGAVVQQLAAFTNTQHRQYIVLGSIVHVNLTVIDAVNQFGEVAISPANQLSDLSEALGKFNVSGNVFSANGANLNINKSVGKVHSQGSNLATSYADPNVVSLASLTALSFQYRFQTGTNGTTGIAINPNIYDVAGVSTAVPPNKVTVQRIYSFVSNNVKIQPGQTLYNSISDAKAGIQTEVFVTEPSITANGILRGFLVVKEGSTNLTSATSAFFYEAGKFSQAVGVGGQSVSSLQNAYDNSIDPEILTDATRVAVSIKRGSGADTDNILEGLNGAGTTTFTVKGNGAVAASGAVTGSNLSGTNTGDQTITLTGGVTGSGTGSFAATVITNANLSGPVTSSGNTTAIADGAIALAKLAATTAGYIPVGAVTTGIPTYVAMSGDVTIGNTGITAIGATKVTNAMLVNTAVANLSGTNTGDNATNSQYTVNPMTTGGDIIFGGASGVQTRLANGTANQILQSNGTTLAPTWVTPGGGSGDMVLASVQTVTGAKTFGTAGGAVGKLLIAGATSGSATLAAPAIAGTITLTLPDTTSTIARNPMTTVGDMVYGAASGVETRLANGTTGQFLSANTGGAPTWATPAGSGDMVLASVQTVTGAKTFGTIGGAVGKLILAGSTSGSSILNAAAIAGSTTMTLPDTSGTLVGSGDTGTVTNTMLAGSIAYSKLSLTGTILNADLAGSIAASKMVALTASRALVSDVSGFVSAATTTSTEIGYVNGVTSAIQTQMDLKAPKASPTFTGTVVIPTPFTLGAVSVTATGTELNYSVGVTSGIQAQINAKGVGDMVLASVQTVTGAKTFGTIGGAVGKLILAGSTSGSTIVNAAAIAGSTTVTFQGITGTVSLNPMTTVGDIVYGAASGVETRLASGTTGQVLQSNTGAAPTWVNSAGVSTAVLYRSISTHAGSMIAALVAGTYSLPYGDSAVAVSGTGKVYPASMIRIDSADYPAVNGVAATMRLKTMLLANDVGLTGNITFGLYPVTRPATSGGTGVIILTMGTVTPSSTALYTNPAADSMATLNSADFAIPADGYYVLGVISSASIAASSLFWCCAELQVKTSAGGIAATYTTTAVNSNITLAGLTTYMVDTSAARTLTLPSPAAGTTISIKDVIGTANTNNITIVRFAAEKIEGVAASKVLQTNWGAWTLTSNGTDWFLV